MRASDRDPAAGAPAPALLLVCGLPASGKSWLAEHLAGPLDADLFQSDVRRRELFAVPAGYRYRGPYDQGMYSPEAKQRIYDSLLADARATLGRGRRAVVDGSFVQRRWRAPFVALARELRVPFAFVEVTAPEDLVRARIEKRILDPDQPSDADWNVYQKLKGQTEPFDDVGPHEHLVLVSERPLDEALAAIAAALRAQRH